MKTSCAQYLPAHQTDYTLRGYGPAYARRTHCLPAIDLSMNLNQVTLPSRDLAVSIPFYEQLGLILIVRALPHYARFECPDGDSTFSLHQVDTFTAGAGTAIYFECEDLDERVATLQKRGITFHLPPTDQSWRWREARLLDPDGHELILFHAGADRKYPPWRIVP